MKRSGCLVCLRPSISLGRRRGCCWVSARMVACPLYDSQSVASQEMGAPFTSSRAAQERCPRRNSASSRLSIDLAFLSLGSLVFFCCLVPFWGPTLPSSKSLTGLFFLKSGLIFNPRSVGSWGGGEEEDWEEFGSWGPLLRLTLCSCWPLSPLGRSFVLDPCLLLLPPS